MHSYHYNHQYFRNIEFSSLISSSLNIYVVASDKCSDSKEEGKSFWKGNIQLGIRFWTSGLPMNLYFPYGPKTIKKKTQTDVVGTLNIAQ